MTAILSSYVSLFSLLADPLQVSKLGNSITVASLESPSVASNVSVFVRAGSRYETYPQTGLTHLLRNSAFLVRFAVVAYIANWENLLNSRLLQCRPLETELPSGLPEKST